MKLNRRQLRRLIAETSKPTMQDILDAQDRYGTRDLSQISSWLGAHEDEVADVLASDKNPAYPAAPDAYGPGESALTDIAAAIEEIISNNVGRVDLDFSDDPLTREDILDFVVRMLHEQR
jgi:hypothetical protein